MNGAHIEWIRSHLRGPRAALLGEPDPELAAALGEDGVRVVLPGETTLDSESFDSVVIPALDPSVDLEAVLDEGLRVLRVGGKLVGMLESQESEAEGDRSARMLRLIEVLTPRFEMQRLDAIGPALGLVATGRSELDGADPARTAAGQLLRQTERAASLDSLVSELRAGIAERDLLTDELESRRSGADGVAPQGDQELAWERDALEADLADVRSESGELTERLQEATEGIAERDEQIRLLEAERDRLEAERARLVGRQGEVDARATAIRKRAEAVQTQRDELRARVKDLEATEAELSTRLRVLGDEHDRVQERLAERARQIESYRASRAYRLSRALWRLRHPRAGRSRNGSSDD